MDEMNNLEPRERLETAIQKLKSYLTPDEYADMVLSRSRNRGHHGSYFSLNPTEADVGSRDFPEELDDLALSDVENSVQLEAENPNTYEELFSRDFGEEYGGGGGGGYNGFPFQ